MNDAPQPTKRQLNGWKEIAKFFGKSPRTVQRWENELDLPVRRLKTSTGESIFALPDELAAWRDGRTETPPDQPDDADDEGLESDGVSRIQVDAGAQRHYRAARWAAVLLMLTAVSALFWYRAAVRRPAVSSHVATAEFRGSTIVARDLAGNEIWTYQFERALVTRPRSQADRDDLSFRPGDPPLVADLDRDGQPEVVAVASFAVADSDLLEQDIVCLTTSGTLQWRYRPEMAYTFRERAFGPTGWNVLDFLVAEPPAEPGVWLALANSPWWGSVVVRLSPDGHSDVRFVNSGALYSLRQVVTSGGWRLLAGGVNNEYHAAALAVIGGSGPAAVSPQDEGSQFQCLNCPTGQPLHYMLFPRTDVNIHEGHKPYNHVWETRRSGAGVEVVTQESASHSAFCFYTLSPTLDPVRLTLSDSTAHGLLESAGKLDHAEADCPLRSRGAAVRTWTPAGGWATVTVPVTPR